MVVYNTGKTPVFIALKIIVDPNGGAGRMDNETKFIVMPGDGIELDILNLKQIIKENKKSNET